MSDAIRDLVNAAIDNQEPIKKPAKEIKPVAAKKKSTNKKPTAAKKPNVEPISKPSGEIIKEDKKHLSLQEQAEEILKIAEESGIQSNFFFLTTFKRYQVQLNILSKLERTIAADGVLCEKEYVKGRKNIYTNPAIGEYNKTASAANSTVTTLINIIKTLRPEDSKQGDIDLATEMRRLLGNE